MLEYIVQKAPYGGEKMAIQIFMSPLAKGFLKQQKLKEGGCARIYLAKLG